MNLQELKILSNLLTPEILEFLKLSQNADTSIMPIRGDKLIQMGEAASVLDVNSSMISRYVKEGLLTAYYTPHSSRRKFWLSEVKGLANKNLKERDKAIKKPHRGDDIHDEASPDALCRKESKA